MKSLIAFMKKECTEQIRSGKAVILGLVFVLLGIMNPAVAKFTPWLLETMADSLAESGMAITVGEVTALDSWTQFYKNLPMGLIAFILLESNLFTKEYSSGTLLLSLTKGLERYKVVLSKTAVLTALWTVGYWACFGITYGYSAYFWDNSVAHELLFSAVCGWVFGLTVVALTVLFSTLFNANTSVLLGTGGVVAVWYLVGMIPKCGKYLPTYLMDGTSLVFGIAEAKTYVPPLIIALVLCVACIAASIPIFNKKSL